MVIYWISLVLEILVGIVFVYALTSFFATDPYSTFYKVHVQLGKVVEPMLRPIRKVIPPLGVGSMGIDFSPLILMIALQVIRQVIVSA